MRDLKDVLAKLGAMSANEIAAHFLDTGVHGRPRTTHRCAVAVYVRQETGARWVVAEPGSVTILYYAPLYPHPDTVPIRVPTPVSVNDFMRKFDRGWYPQLEVR